MARLILKGIVVLVLIFCATLGAMRAQPYDDGGLRAQLATSDCAQPCFLGIQPGVTTRAQALALLRANPWVAAINATDDRIIEWTWNGSQPAFLRTASGFTRILVENNLVHWIGVETSARIGDVKIAFGAPDATYYFNWQSRDSSKNVFTYFEQHGLYFTDQFTVAVSTLCPITATDIWQLPVTLALPAPPVRSAILPIVYHAFAPLPQVCQ